VRYEGNYASEIPRITAGPAYGWCPSRIPGDKWSKICAPEDRARNGSDMSIT
jgi:hypothetical protein